MIQNLFGKKIILILIILFAGVVAVAVYVSQKNDDGTVVRESRNNLSETETAKTQLDSTITDRPKEQKQETVQDIPPAKKDVLEETRKLLITLSELPNNGTIADVRNYVTPPLQNRPFVYYCDNNFVLQYIGGDYHKLEYYSSSFRKTNECEATFAIGSAEPHPASCSIASACKPVEDFIYPLILKTDKSSYKYGDEITVTLASNPNRNKSIELIGAVSPYCAGLHLERIGKISQDWIQDSISRPGSGGGADCPHNIIIGPASPYAVKIRIDDTGTVPPGKWRVVHKSDVASLETGFWLEPLNQEQFGCHVSGGTYVGCPASGGTGLCIPCSCSKGFSWSPVEKQCLKTTAVPMGYDPNRIDVKYRVGVDVSNPITLLPNSLQVDVVNIGPLAPAGGPEFRWLRFDLKITTDEGIFITQLRALEWVEIAEFAPLPAPPP